MILSVRTEKHKQIFDITDPVAQTLANQDRATTACLLFVKHTTCTLTTADLDPGTDLDMLDAFDRLIPHLTYRHPHNPAHVPDHILSSLIGPSLMIPTAHGQLVLGTWQRIVLVELDGPREREISINFL